MKMIKAIVRVEKADDVAKATLDAGYPAMTRFDVYGRGKQKGIKVGTVFYDELPKKMILMVVEDEDVDKVVKIITDAARTGEEGNFGDGRIFVSNVEDCFTISSLSESL
ncbi:MAG: P-II family nitrogen regulator [Thomasclavelia sp.]|jgi:nitrogen regulatory protein PII 1|nr:P-II family nitrogen regulator [Thomasclavelia sp.]